MANYIASARSNYFCVNDVEGLGDILPGGVSLHRMRGDPSRICLLVDYDDVGGWPTDFYNEETEDYEEFDWAERLAPFLLDDEVAIFMEAGAEKLRYLHGHAFAFNNKGEFVYMSLNDIYDKAASLGNNITRAEY